MAFVNPESVVKQLPLEAGMTVADLGAGTGIYSIRIAKRIAPGKVYAIEVMKELANSIKQSAKRENLSNVEIIWGDSEPPGGTKLADNSVDLAVVSNVLSQAESKEGILNEAKRILKPHGRALVIDWRESFGGMGPHPNFVVTKEAAQKMFLNSGFTLEGEVNADDYHYGFLFRKL